ncbi:MAG: GIY-YIG nuclease family protein [Treponema sp.]|nr:GIY-YIG nuclease family protein [Treponema sp.]
MKEIQSGYVYIYGHSAFPFLMKIGSSVKKDERLEAQLFATNLPVPGFQILRQKVRDYKAVEDSIHQILKEYHCETNEHFITAGDEWFFYCDDSIKKARKVISNFATKETEDEIEKKIIEAENDPTNSIFMKNGNLLYIKSNDIPNGYIAQTEFKKDYYNFQNIRPEKVGNKYGYFVIRVISRSRAQNINAYIVNKIKCFRKDVLEQQRQFDSENSKSANV